MNSHYQPGFPITEEMPVVMTRAPRRWGGALIMLATVAVAAIFGLAIYVASDRNSESADVAIVTPVPQATVGIGPSEVTELEPQAAALWQVVGVEGGLNVRAAPGTSTAIIGAFAAGERNIAGTGERAEVNGSPWTQVELGAGVQGWVSSRFLAADDGSAEPTPVPVAATGTLTSTVCFQSVDSVPFRTIRLNYFDRTNIQGQIRTDQADLIRFESVTGTLQDGRADVSIVAEDSEDARSQDWRFDPASLRLTDDESVRVVDCNAVNGFFP